MAEYIVGHDALTTVTPETWLGQYWLSVRALRGEEAGPSRSEAEEFLRDQALGNPSAAIRRRCWLAMEQHGVSGMADEDAPTSDRNNR